MPRIQHLPNSMLLLVVNAVLLDTLHCTVGFSIISASTNTNVRAIALPYPAVCLLIASVHSETAGHETFTFEMLFDAFKTQLRTSQSAPVHVAGGGLGMVRCSREVMFSVRLPLPIRP